MNALVIIFNIKNMENKKVEMKTDGATKLPEVAVQDKWESVVASVKKQGGFASGVAVQSHGKVVPTFAKGHVAAVFPSAVGFKISDLSDEQLYKKCVEYGMNAKEWIRKFAAMLPEVEKRFLHKKKGFVSLYDFAKKLAGMSNFTVDRILRLAKRIADKPVLLRQFESGKQSWSKIETVSYIATKETDEDLARKVETLPQRALMAYTSQKRTESVLNGNVNFGNIDSASQGLFGLEKIFDEDSNVLINYQDIRQEERYKVFLFHASMDIEFKLRLFKQRLEKERKQSFSWNEVFEVLFQKLDERRRDDDVKKNEEKMREYNVNRGKPSFVKDVKDVKDVNVVNVVNVVVKNNDFGKSLIEKGEVGKDIKLDYKKINNPPSRHIPVVLKRQILAKYGYKCGFPKCNFPCFVLHHTKRFVLFRRHDSESIVPLCNKHHDLVHGGCIENEEDVPEKWVLKKVVTIGDGGGGEHGVKGKYDAEGRSRLKIGEWKNDDWADEVGCVDKHTGEVLDTKDKVDAVVMKYKMKNVR